MDQDYIQLCAHCDHDFACPKYDQEREKTLVQLRSGGVPMPLEVSHFEAAELRIGDDIARHDTEIRRLLASVQALRESKEKLQNLQGTIRSVLSPLRGLPREILEIVFSFLPDQKTILRVAGVCKTWHGIAITSPRLWTRLILDYKRGPKFEDPDMEMLALYIDRSKAMPLVVQRLSIKTLSFYTYSRRTVDLVLERGSNRLTSLTLDLSRVRGDRADPWKYSDFDLQNLEQLRIVKPEQADFVAFRNCPKLRTLILEDPMSSVGTLPPELRHIHSIRFVHSSWTTIVRVLGSYQAAEPYHDVTLVNCSGIVPVEPASLACAATSLKILIPYEESRDDTDNGESGSESSDTHESEEDDEEDLDSDADGNISISHPSHGTSDASGTDSDSPQPHEDAPLSPNVDSFYDRELTSDDIALRKFLAEISIPALDSLTIAGMHSALLIHPKFVRFMDHTQTLRRLEIYTGPYSKGFLNFGQLISAVKYLSLTSLSLHDDNIPGHEALITSGLLTLLTIPDPSEVRIPRLSELETLELTLPQAWFYSETEQNLLVQMAASRRRTSPSGRRGATLLRTLQLNLAKSEGRRLSQSTVQDLLQTFALLTEMKAGGLELITSLQPPDHFAEMW